MKTLNISGHLLELTPPRVMGILNVTPDSFYPGSRKTSEEEIRLRVKEMLEQGADIIDVGGCSTRPGFETPSEKEEMERVALGCRIVRELSRDIPLSVDTFRASVAREAIDKWEAGIINDISGGVDPLMWPLVAGAKVAYVLTHNRFDSPVYEDITATVITELSYKVSDLHRLGVNDVIIDPGFGFAKTLEENFRLLAELEEFAKTGWPILVGVSRKSMIYKTLGCQPEESLTGTIALDTVALMKGADILRVHDIKPAKETVTLISKLSC